MPAKLLRLKQGKQVFMVIRFIGEINAEEALDFNRRVNEALDRLNKSTSTHNSNTKGENAGLGMVLANNARKIEAKF